MFDEFLHFLWRLGELGVLLMLPVAVLSVGEKLVHAVAPGEYRAVPGLSRFSVLSGLIAGGLLVYANHQGAWYEFDTVFDPQGPWAVPFTELFTVWLHPARYSPMPLWDAVSWASFDITEPFDAFVAASVTLAGLALLGSVRFFGLAAPRAVIASALVWLWGAALAVYIVCAAAWALNMLNFWAIVLTFLVYRHYGLKAH